MDPLVTDTLRFISSLRLRESVQRSTICALSCFIYVKGAKIQLLDLPGIIEGAKDGKGRGKQVIAVARTCGLVLIVLDAMKPLTHKRIIEKELEGFGIRYATSQS